MPFPVELPPTDGSTILWEGRSRLVTVGGHPGFILPAEFSRSTTERAERARAQTVRAVMLAWGGQWLKFSVSGLRKLNVIDHDGARPRPGHVVFLARHDLTQLFDAADGSIRRVTRLESQFRPSDYSLRGVVAAKLLSVMPYAAGISPTLPNDTDHFAGRLILFTGHHVYVDRTVDPPVPRAAFSSQVSIAIAHEFGHSLGTPHKCGHWAFRHDGSDSCAMNYPSHPVRRNDAFVPGSVGRDGSSFCGLHISQLRKVLLQDNPVFRGQGW